MSSRQPSDDSAAKKHAARLPRLWLMTDERIDDALLDIIINMPERSGIVFRHYHLSPDKRRARFVQIKPLAERKDHMLFLAGSPELAKQWDADGIHNAGECDCGELLRSASVHNESEYRTAEQNGANIIFLSPIFETDSHPDAEPLPSDHRKRIAQNAKMPVIALGGMDEDRARRLIESENFHGWAGIGALAQKYGG